MRHRYLDLRRPGQANALRMRSKVNQLARDVLLERDFVEVETPTLTRSTPEGAGLPGAGAVAARTLVRVAAVAATVQAVADGGRDGALLPDRLAATATRTSRADRQPEFTQLDIEMSFVRDPPDWA